MKRCGVNILDLIFEDLLHSLTLTGAINKLGLLSSYRLKLGKCISVFAKQICASCVYVNKRKMIFRVKKALRIALTVNINEIRHNAFQNSETDAPAIESNFILSISA